MANQTAYLDDMLRWGLDWLMKVFKTKFSNNGAVLSAYIQAHSSPNTLYVQVGDSE